MNLPGLHHVTAVTADPVKNYRFYTETLGLRLVKKTVNQDDISAYHLFYSDNEGSPGTDMTFFHWPHVSASRPGPGTIDRTLFLIPSASVDFWRERLAALTSSADPEEAYDGATVLRFTDFEGQRLGLVTTDSVPEDVATVPGNDVPAEHQIRGFASVEIRIAPDWPTGDFLERYLNFSALSPSVSVGNETVFRYRTGSGVRGGAAFGDVHLIEDAGATRRGAVGVGGVHHVAYRVPDRETQDAVLSELTSNGVPTSGLVDRFYFRSVYFREPGGVLFEIATDGPGFAVDENPDTLGASLALPPFLESRRSEIEAGLVPLTTG
ncbi:MAG: ring-cleaving dioxygenase [Spirochaetaceae bacterium]